MKKRQIQSRLDLASHYLILNIKIEIIVKNIEIEKLKR